MIAFGFIPITLKLIDFLRSLANARTQRSAIVTQLLAWAGGVGAIALGAHASVTAGEILPGMSVTLGSLDAASVVLVGLAVGSTASLTSDVKRAIDRSDSASVPALIKSPE